MDPTTSKDNLMEVRVSPAVVVVVLVLVAAILVALYFTVIAKAPTTARAADAAGVTGPAAGAVAMPADPEPSAAPDAGRAQADGGVTDLAKPDATSPAAPKPVGLTVP